MTTKFIGTGLTAAQMTRFAPTTATLGQVGAYTSTCTVVDTGSATTVTLDDATATNPDDLALYSVDTGKTFGDYIVVSFLIDITAYPGDNKDFILWVGVGNNPDPAVSGYRALWSSISFGDAVVETTSKSGIQKNNLALAFSTTQTLTDRIQVSIMIPGTGTMETAMMQRIDTGTPANTDAVTNVGPTVITTTDTVYLSIGFGRGNTAVGDTSMTVAARYNVLDMSDQ